MSPAASVDNAVSEYLRALKDPNSLRNDETISALEGQLESSPDSLERLRLRQQLLDAQAPSIDRYEEGFVTHAKAWADDHAISGRAFVEEGVPSDVLRRAGFDVAATGGRGRRSGAAAAAGGTRKRRVTVDEVRKAIPSTTFTIKHLQEKSGASPAVVRKVVQEGLDDSSLVNAGTDRDHRGPGRAPVLYQKKA